jgi:DNA invertase Pin-like site-specific DNA recombinase
LLASLAPTVASVAYIRTSSPANVGPDKDSDTRQELAIQAFAKRAGFDIVETFRDPAVPGKDDILKRPGFAKLLERIATNGVKTVIVEDASRFARHLMTQETGIATLIGLGVRVLAANGDDLTDTDDEFRIAMRQMLGVFAQLEKTRLVKKLRGARERKRATGVKVEGRKSHAESRPEVVAEAKRLRRASPKTGERLSYRDIAAKLAEAGHVSKTGKPFTAMTVMRMIEGDDRRLHA